MMAKPMIVLVPVLFLIAACNSAGHPGDVSECGGFGGFGNSSALTAADADTYCDAEVLTWTYDSAEKTLSLSNERVSLNCCGAHSVAIQQTDTDIYVVSEVDAPEFGDARCGCMCVFDFRVTGVDVPERTITLELTREVTDSETPFVEVFSGQIDLTEGSGRIVIDESDLAMGCGEPVT